MRRTGGGAAALLLLAGLGAAGAAEQGEPKLTREHAAAGGAFSFRTPEDWRVGPVPGAPDFVEARGGGLIVRFLHQRGEQGLDALHATCMEARLAPPMEIDPRVLYEHDFVGGSHEGRRLLDSAFVLRYDAAIEGQREWRQRNLTMVGGGDSLCAIGHAPARAYRRSVATRRLLDAVLGSVRFARALAP